MSSDDEEAVTDADTTIVGVARSTISRLLDGLIAEARERGIDDSDLLEHLDFTRMFDPVAESIADLVGDRQGEYVAQENDYRRGFNERLRGYYGPALDGLRVFIDLCIESTSSVHQRGEGEVDQTGEVLLDLHARACLVSQEVHTLLSNGFPFGALAEWRTVHELSVLASIIEDHGRIDGGDLTKRWLACDSVTHYRDARIYQERAERLGYDPISENDVATLRTRSEEAVHEFGKSIADLSGYGWAEKICRPERATFRRLEELAGRGHLRGHYRWASHRVHGDSRGNASNWMERGSDRVRLAGSTNMHLVDAADLTLGSLWIATNAVLTGVRNDEAPEAAEVVVMLVLERLLKPVTQAFIDAEAKVEEAERQLQAQDQRNMPSEAHGSEEDF